MPAFNPDDAPVATGAAASDSVPVIDLGGAAGVTDPAVIARVAGEIGEAAAIGAFSGRQSRRFARSPGPGVG